MRIIGALLGLLQRYYCTLNGTQYLHQLFSTAPPQECKNLFFFSSSDFLSRTFTFITVSLYYLWALRPSVQAVLLQ